MAMTLCAAGKHYYDSAVQSGCPYCGESASSGSSHTAAIPAAPEERTQMLTADSHQLAAQSAKTQMLDNPAPAAESDSALKTHILGVSNQPDAEARAKGMCEFPVVGWLIITEGQGRGKPNRPQCRPGSLPRFRRAKRQHRQPRSPCCCCLRPPRQRILHRAWQQPQPRHAQR